MDTIRDRIFITGRRGAIEKVKGHKTVFFYLDILIHEAQVNTAVNPESSRLIELNGSENF